MRRRVLRFLVALGAGVVASTPWLPSEAQYFGQNRVQYRQFDFRTLSTAHFDIYYYPEEEQAARIAARLAERWNARLSRLLDYNLPDRQPVIFYATFPDFQQTNVFGGEAPGEGTGGVTESLKRRVVLPFAGPLAETDHVLGHELVHAFQYSLTGQRSTGGFANPTVGRLPLWFVEGMAEYLSVGPVDAHTAMWMRDAVKQDKLPKISDLNSGKYFPYRWGQALWAYIGGRWGDPVVGKILKAAGRQGEAEPAIERILGVKIDVLSKEWHEALKAAYKPLLEADKKAPETQPKPLLEEGSGKMTLAPALSPDGNEMVFLSEKSLFALELYLADTKSGRIEERVSNTALDPHLDSLQFINSAGAWDMTGTRFAYAVITSGRPALALLDVRRRTVAREVELPGMGEVFSPTWSPDGTRIAFSANVGGVMDLYVYDLEASRLTQLTEDAFADLQPAWSPDGKTIVFVTDRFSSDLEALRFGNYRLGLIDPETRAIEPLPTFKWAKNISPQWSADSASVFFIADQDGVQNVYRVERASGRLFKVTNLSTGASGITPLSPALSVASRGERLAYTSYGKERYQIYSLEGAEALAGTPVEPEPGVVDFALLPPEERSNDEVAALRKDTSFGLPDAGKYKQSPYRARLALDYVSQPYIAAGSDRFGSFVGGGTSLMFSDMLGNHTVTAVFQAQGGLNDIALLGGYTNLKRRLNWGIMAGQVPYVYGDFAWSYTPEGYLAQEALLYRQINRQVSLLAAYPLSRAKRIEVNGGYRHISFERELQTTVYEPTTGQFLYYDEQTESYAPSMDLAETSAAFVHDTSVFGATAPLLGRRYRFEVSGTTGSVTYAGVLADFRQYVMPVRPFTLAGRVLHYGRYGRDAENRAFTPLFLGYEGLLRGYDYDSFTASECDAATQTCPIIQRIAGSRLLIANAELRFPLFGVFGSSSYYGPFPIEAVAFYDVGVAWDSTTSPGIDLFGKEYGGARKPVSSVGAGFRINVFGLLVFELDYVRPLDRPGKGAYWKFGFVPGF